VPTTEKSGAIKVPKRIKNGGIFFPQKIAGFSVYTLAKKWLARNTKVYYKFVF